MSNIYLAISDDDAETIWLALGRYINNPGGDPDGPAGPNIRWHREQAERIREGLGEAMRSDVPRRWASHKTEPFTWTV